MHEGVTLNSDTHALMKTLASLLRVNGPRSRGSPPFWQAWDVYLQPPLLQAIADCMFDRFESEFRAADALVAIPASGIPLATLAHLRFAKPMLSLDFEGRHFKVASSLVRSAQRLVVVDAAVNGGGTVRHAQSILTHTTRATLLFVVVVVNDLLPPSDVLPARDHMIRSGSLRYLFSASVLAATQAP